MLLITTQIAVIATGLLAGVFLTFSDFIMRSLTSARPEAGAKAGTLPPEGLVRILQGLKAKEVFEEIVRNEVPLEEWPT